MKKQVTRYALAALLGALVMVGAAPVSAQVSFEGETIEWWVPFKEGGGTDVWARALAPWISQYLPGEPTIVIKNNTQGGGIGGANEYARRAEPTGRMIFATSGSIQIPYLLKDKLVRYDYDDWVSVFAAPTGGVVYVPSEFGVASAENLSALNDHTLRYGSQGVSTLDLVPLLGFELLGLDVEAVFGFKSRSNARLSMLRNETTIDYQTTSSYLKHVQPLVEEGKMTPLFSWGALDADGNIVRDPTFPDLPSLPEVYEMAHGKPPEGPAFDAWKAFFAAGFGSQKFIMMPKDTPAEVVQAYREAMANMVQDPEFQAALKDKLGDYPPIVGDELDAALERAVKVPAEAEAWVTDWLAKRYNFKS